MTTDQAARATDSELLGERVDTPTPQDVLDLLDRICPWGYGPGNRRQAEYHPPAASDVHVYGRTDPLRLRLTPYPHAKAQQPTTALRLSGHIEGYVAIQDIDAITVVQW